MGHRAIFRGWFHEGNGKVCIEPRQGPRSSEFSCLTQHQGEGGGGGEEWSTLELIAGEGQGK